jgi:hypothetical protein
MLLNAASRQYILNTALEHAFGARLKAKDLEYDRIAMAIYNALFTKAQQEHINALPKCFYVTGKCHRVNVAGQRREWRFNGTAENTGVLTSLLRLPADEWREIGVLRMDKHEALINRIAEYDAMSKKLNEERGKAESTLNALLKSLRTVEALKEAWPEGHRFYKGVKAAVPTPPGLPAVAMADLNKMLGVAA